MIYVLGSLNMDISAQLIRMPESGETISSNGFMVNAGGKGLNQAVAAAKMGGKVKMIGKVGTDFYGTALKKALTDAGADISAVTEAEGQSGTALILVEGGDNRIIIDKAANYKITFADVDDGLKEAKAGDILVCQLEIPIEIVSYAFALAKRKSMVTLLNPAPAANLPDGLLINTDIITPNETETEMLTGIVPSGDVEIALAVKEFYLRGIKNVIITLGGKGSAVSHGKTITHIAPFKTVVVDTTSAGDTFIGAAVLKLSEGWDIIKACGFASAAASVTVTRRGASISIPDKNEAEEAYLKYVQMQQQL